MSKIDTAASQKSLEQRQKDLIAEFSKFKDWEDRYRKIIDLGKDLPALANNKKIEENKVKGCQSQVWLVASLADSGKMMIQGDSDALIVRGLVALLVRLFSGVPPEEILATPVTFIKDLGFEGNISPSRSNGFFSMLKQIHNYATAFVVLKGMKK